MTITTKPTTTNSSLRAENENLQQALLALRQLFDEQQEKYIALKVENKRLEAANQTLYAALETAGE